MRCFIGPCRITKLAGSIGTPFADHGKWNSAAAVTSSEPANLERNVHPFQIRYRSEDIDDLKQRLAKTRWPEQLQTVQWEYGMDLSYAKELAAYWQHTFDWEKAQSSLNSLPHFLAHDINGLENIHFLHQKSAASEAKPLLLVHGWPGSFYEFKMIISELTDPSPGRQAYHVVAPSLPGYNFSSAPQQPGFGIRQMAKTLNELMIHLGYNEYYAQGGDWGGIICKALGLEHSSHCKAIHVNFMIPKMPNLLNPLHLAEALNYKLFPGTPLLLSKEEIWGLKQSERYQDSESGYFSIQGTKPQTLAYSLNDSPVGLMAWMVEKFQTWTDCGGNVESRLSKDEQLTMISMYWFTRSMPSATRLYKEFKSLGEYDSLVGAYCKVPTAYAVFPFDALQVPRTWASAQFNLQKYKMFTKGGHFAALEEPELLVSDIHDFFDNL